MQDLTGKRFGKLTVLKFAFRKGKHYYWECQCDCGNVITIRRDSLLKSNATQSCGCITIEKSKKRFTTHGLWGTRLYNIYHNMKHRCLNPQEPGYGDYGGRGIKIYDKWLKDFSQFSQWAIENGYKTNLTLDRIDVNGNYEPSNCRWITNKEQQRNKRTNRFITYNNETYCLTDWALKLGISSKKLNWRINHKWSIERAFNTP